MAGGSRSGGGRRAEAARGGGGARSRKATLLALAPLLLSSLLLVRAASAQSDDAVPAPSPPTRCIPVAGEFVLTGLTNPDGNRINHELGVCLPAFSFEVRLDCTLTLTAKPGQGNAAVSLFTTGLDSQG